MESPDEAISIAQRAVVSRRLFFSHRIARPLFFLSMIEIVCALAFASIPDARSGDSDQQLGIYVLQAVLAWVNVVISFGCMLLVFATYSATHRELTFERQSREIFLQFHSPLPSGDVANFCHACDDMRFSIVLAHDLYGFCASFRRGLRDRPQDGSASH